MRNLVLLSYGNQIEYNRAIYAIFSFLAWKEVQRRDTRIAVFTDSPSSFTRFLSEFDIYFVQLTEDRLIEMLGGTDYVHRRKICILQEVFRLFPKDDILYLDSDTFFIADPSPMLDQIDPESSIMHIREYRLQDAPKIYAEIMSDRLPRAEEYPRSFLRFIGQNEIEILDKRLRFNKEQYVWNSGVIGIDNKILPALDGILAFNDKIFPATKWFISEQLSFALILQSLRNLRPANSYINHYYQSKKVVDVFTNNALKGNFFNLTAAEKLLRIKAGTIILDRLSKVDLYISISRGSFSRKEFRKGLHFAVRALKKIPVSPFAFDYFRSKFLIARDKKKKS